MWTFIKRNYSTKQKKLRKIKPFVEKNKTEEWTVDFFFEIVKSESMLNWVSIAGPIQQQLICKPSVFH